MKNLIETHPSLIYANDIASICKPLLSLNISYFAHVNIDQSGQFSAITNNPKFTKHYLDKKYYNVDIHMAKEDLLTDYFIWDSIERRGASAVMHQEAAEFGVKHTFTIIDEGHNGHNYYHFATDLVGKTINQIYSSHLDLLKVFIMHFKDSVNQSKHLSDAYDLKFAIDSDATGYLTNEDSKELTLNSAHIRKLFWEELRSFNKNDVFSTDITLRELEILWWLHLGKTIDDIAAILGRASITINRQIAEIKNKTRCYTQFQLGEFFSNLSK
jgi:hypothetical protein